MSAKTKIVVLHMKELIYTGIFAALGILFLVLLILMFLPGKKDKTNAPAEGEESSGADTAATSSESIYIPGIYTTELVLGGQTVDVEVIVSSDAITSVNLVNLSESVTTMYPLLQPTFDSICGQIYETQSLDQVSYTSESKYTSLVLLEAIKNSLEKATKGKNPSGGSSGNTSQGSAPQGNTSPENASQGSPAQGNTTSDGAAAENLPSGNTPLENAPQGNTALEDAPQNAPGGDGAPQGNTAAGEAPQESTPAS